MVNALCCAGSLGLLWIVFWLIFGAGKPDDSVLISDVEKQYIAHCLSENSIIETRRKVGHLLFVWQNIKSRQTFKRSKLWWTLLCVIVIATGHSLGLHLQVKGCLGADYCSDDN